MWSTGKWILFSVGLIGLLMTCPQRIYATITTPNVVVANTVVGGVSEYNVTFTTTVALVKRKDDIFITFPSGTVPPAGSSEVDTSSVYEPAVKGLVTPGLLLNCTVMVVPDE